MRRKSGAKIANAPNTHSGHKPQRDTQRAYHVGGPDRALTWVCNTSRKICVLRSIAALSKPVPAPVHSAMA